MRKADNLQPSCAVVMKSENLNFLEPFGPLLACNGTALSLPLGVYLCALTIPTYEARAAQSALPIGFGLNGRGVTVRLLAGTYFLFCTTCRPALKPTQRAFRYVWGKFFQGQSGRRRELTTHLCLVSRLRMRGPVPPLSLTSLWRVA